MTYSVRRTNGQALVDVAPGTIDVSRSVTLIGKNYAGYGALIAENFVPVSYTHLRAHET